MSTELTKSSSFFPFRPETVRSFTNRYLTPATVLLFIASLFADGLISFEFLDLSVTSWDLAIIPLALNAGLLLAVNDRGQTLISRTALVLGAAFAAWVLVSAIRSPEDFRGYTMALLLLRSYVMAVSLIIVLHYSMDLGRFNRLFFGVGIAMAVLAIILFLPAADDLGSRRPHGSKIILIDEFQIPRITGLTSDPNFFAMSVLMSLFFVLAFVLNRRNSWTWAGAAVLVFAAVLTFSRAGYAAFFAGLGVMVLFLLIRPGPSYRRQLVRSFAALYVVALATFLVAAQVEMNLGRSVWELTSLRFERITESPRLALWRDLLEPAEPVSPTEVPVDPVATLVTPTETPVAIATATPAPDPDATSPAEVTATSSPEQAPTAVPGETAVPDLTPTRPASTATSVPAPTPTHEPETTEPEPPAPSNGEPFWETFLGNGLRSNEVRLGTYSHSSYLDVTEEMGVVGTALWGTIALLIAVVLVRAALSSFHAVPWIPVYAVVLVMMSSLSMLFMPYFWLVAAVAVHLSRRLPTGERNASIATSESPKASDSA